VVRILNTPCANQEDPFTGGMYDMHAQLIFAAIVASSVAAAAAQYPPARPEQKPQQQQEKQQAQTVTVTGCLQTTSTATQPATTEPTQPQREPGSSDQQFVLAQAKVSGGAAATGTAGTTGTAGSLASADKFRLIGGKPMELKEHLNHRVEITGTLQPRSERGQEKGAGVGDPQKRTDAASLPALRVTGFKHVAETCGPADK
jgi:hypothetical protein